MDGKTLDLAAKSGDVEFWPQAISGIAGVFFVRHVHFTVLAMVTFSMAATANAQSIDPKVKECQFPRPGFSLENPASDFVENGPGMVLHTKTNLTWYRCNLGQEFVEKTESYHVPQCSAGSTPDTKFSINEAVRVANEVNIGGKRWRLPTAAELGSILESGCKTSYFNGRIFNGIRDQTLWTSNVRDGEPVAFSAQRYEPDHDSKRDTANLEDGLFTMNTKNLKLEALIVSE